MSAGFEDRKINRKNSAPKAAYNFDLITGRKSDTSSCDESDDTRGDFSLSSTSRISLSLCDRQRHRIEYTIDTNGTNLQTKILEENLGLPHTQKLAISPISEDGLLPKFEDLTLDSDFESVTINRIAKLSLNGDHKPLAGVVTSVAKVIGLIVVKPPMPHDVLLHLGSPVFLRKSVSKDVKLGWIIDVFGPACEPYYCVKPVNNGIDLVHEGNELFYSPDHPRTAFLCLKQEDGNRYTVMYSPRCPSIRDHQVQVSGQSAGDDDFWSKASRGDFPHRQIHRRRRRGNNRGAQAYRNKYQNNLRTFHPVQPKHSYFDY